MTHESVYACEKCGESLSPIAATPLGMMTPAPFNQCRCGYLSDPRRMKRFSWSVPAKRIISSILSKDELLDLKKNPQDFISRIVNPRMGKMEKGRIVISKIKNEITLELESNEG